MLARRLRLLSGLAIFAYVCSHLLNLGLGLSSLEVMEKLRPYFLWVWQTWPGQILLYVSLALHMGLGLLALYRRRTLRLEAYDALQLLLALALPMLLVLHVLGTRVATAVYGLEPDYGWLMMIYWKWSPAAGLRQVFVLLAAWAHGCMGLYTWMRVQRWWPRWQGFLYPWALLIPVVALLGFAEAGKEALALADDPAFRARIARHAAIMDAQAVAALYRAQEIFLWAWAGLVVAVLLARAVRVAVTGVEGVTQVSYVGGPVVRAEAGLSVLEVSLGNDVPHVHRCRGKGRCGTCRVRVAHASTTLPAPAELELETLKRVGAPAGVRLACQLVPGDGAVTVERLVEPGSESAEVDGRLDEGGAVPAMLLLIVEYARPHALLAHHAPQDAKYLIERWRDDLDVALVADGGRRVSHGPDGLAMVFDADRAGRWQSILDTVRASIETSGPLNGEASADAWRVVLACGALALVGDEEEGGALVALGTVVADARAAGAALAGSGAWIAVSAALLGDAELSKSRLAVLGDASDAGGFALLGEMAAAAPDVADAVPAV